MNLHLYVCWSNAGVGIAQFVVCHVLECETCQAQRVCLTPLQVLSHELSHTIYGHTLEGIEAKAGFAARACASRTSRAQR